MADICLHCFHLLAFVNDAAMKTSILHIDIWGLVFNSFGFISRSGIAESYGNSIFNFVRNHHNIFSWSLYHFTLSPIAQGFQFLHILIQTFLLLFLILSSLPKGCEVIYHLGFDLHFANDKWYWASFHIFVDHLCVGGEIWRSLVYFFIALLGFFVVEVQVLYMFDSEPLYNVWFTNIFFHAVGWLFNMLIVSFDTQKFLIWCPIDQFWFVFLMFLVLYVPT